ncbi:MAG: hypothetical protein VKI81_01285 [Synechococcaceae cyanobacterium]|nr:hypothetical protein [Synechococcaceae cyanobacterium]
MAADPLDALRLTLMQDVLPVGLAVVERARRGGPARVFEAFDGRAPDPIGRLREEGEPAASEVRQNLDRLAPGLGNPVMKVEVRDVPEEPTAPGTAGEPESLEELEKTLQRIAEHLDLLERRLGAASPAGDEGSSRGA